MGLTRGYGCYADREVRVERATKLRRYLRKDYTQVVDFPVEIVGRDGLVRRYSFDDSVRLYNRRIHSAPLRYDDDALIDAEIRHCRQRIDQLRRSYLEHFGWQGLRGGQMRGVAAGPLAAEVAAFLRTAYSAEPYGPSALRLSLVSTGVGDVYYLQHPGLDRCWLLYVWRVDGAGPRGARAAWRAAVDGWTGAPEAEGVERIFALNEGYDLALVLTGTGPWAGPARVVNGDPEDVLGDSADPYQGGLRAVYEGNAGLALRLFERGMDAPAPRPWVAQAAAIVALADGQAERAEFAARFAHLQHPRDPVAVYLLGVALARQGRLDEAARVAADAAPGTSPNGLLALLLGLVALAQGAPLRAWSALGPATRGSDFAGRAGRTLRRALRRLLLAACAAVALGALGVWAVQVAAPAVAIGLACVGGIGVATALRPLRAWRRSLLTTPDRGPRLVSLELLPRERESHEPN